MSKGMFIVLEGPEGAGKTTQAARLGKMLRYFGHDTLVTREPGGTPNAERIRELIFELGDLDATAQYLLFAAARVEHVNKKIIPALEQGKTVISDRFIGSSVALQGYAEGVDVDVIGSVYTRTVGVSPYVTVLLDVPPEVSMKRLEGRSGKTRFDEKGLDYYEKVRHGYLDQALAFGWPIVDATADEDSVYKAMYLKLMPFLHAVRCTGQAA